MVDVDAKGEEVSDTKFKATRMISSDRGQRVRKIKALQQLGATAIVSMRHLGQRPRPGCCAPASTTARAFAGADRHVLVLTFCERLVRPLTDASGWLIPAGSQSP